MKLLLILMLIFLVSCGKDGKALYVEPSSQKYVTRFEQLSNIRIDNLIVEIKPLEARIMGVCTTGMTTPRIALNSLYWSNLSESEREELVFHELGHCVLGYGHDDSTLNIMNTYFFEGDIYEFYYGELLTNFYKRDYNKLKFEEY